MSSRTDRRPRAGTGAALATAALTLLAVLPASASTEPRGVGPLDGRAVVLQGQVDTAAATTPPTADETTPPDPTSAAGPTPAVVPQPSALLLGAAPFGAFDGPVPAAWPAPPAVTAASWVLADLDSGQVLASRDPDTLRPTASTIKVLTTWTVLRRRDLDDVVVVPPSVVGIEGASAGLAAGQRLSVEQLLRLVVARSANDAATALAIDVAGSVPAFTALMEADAREVGVDVRVADAAGLSDRTRTSARALAVLTRHAMADPAFRSLAGAREAQRPDGVVEATRNTLLTSYPGATGVKTGFTSAAGGTLVATAVRDGAELLAVVLGSDGTETRFSDATALLDHGFAAFETTDVTATWELGDAATAALDVDVLLPVDLPDGDVAVRLADVPAEVRGMADQPPLVATVTARGQLVDEVAVLLDADDAPPTTLAGWLVDRSQAALRATVP